MKSVTLVKLWKVWKPLPLPSLVAEAFQPLEPWLSLSGIVCFLLIHFEASLVWQDMLHLC